MEGNTSDFKIWPPYEVFYIESMLTVTKTAMWDQSSLRQILEEIENGNNENKQMLLDLIHNIVNQAAAISRYFWPVTKTAIHQKRGEKLRQAFNVQENNILKDRKVRNFIEHFDEKLDVYIQKGIAGTIIPSYIGSRNPKSDTILHFFRAFYLDDWTFSVLGEEYQIQPIINELIRIHLLLEEYSNNGRLPK